MYNANTIVPVIARNITKAWLFSTNTKKGLNSLKLSTLHLLNNISLYYCNNNIKAYLQLWISLIYTYKTSAYNITMYSKAISSPICPNKAINADCSYSACFTIGWCAAGYLKRYILKT